jgi:hypothetical protein
MIRNGRYNVPREHGLLPGTYHVEISSADSAAPPVMIRAHPGERGIPVQPERIPPDYNVESEKSVEVLADKNNQFDFDILTRGTGKAGETRPARSTSP